MADRIFPNTYQEEPLDSDLVFKGIDWDNFNARLAEVKNAPKQELPEEFREVLAEKMPKDVKEMFEEKSEKSKPSKEDREDLSDVPEQLREHVKKKQHKDGKETCPACNCDPCECDDDDKGKKKSKDHNYKLGKFHRHHLLIYLASSLRALLIALERRLNLLCLP